MRTYETKPLADRVWPRVSKSNGDDGCWLWRGYKNENGYGQMYTRTNGRRSAKLVHRVVWELVRGPIPSGLGVCHKCDVPACVNPKHLFLGDQVANMSDASRKGRIVVPGFRGEKNPNSKLSEADARAILNKAWATNPRLLGMEYGVSRGTVRAIWGGRSWHYLQEAPCLASSV